MMYQGNRRYVCLLFVALLPGGLALAQHAGEGGGHPRGVARFTVVAETFAIPKALALRLLMHPAEKETVKTFLDTGKGRITKNVEVPRREQAALEVLAHIDEKSWVPMLKELDAKIAKAEADTATPAYLLDILRRVRTFAETARPAVVLTADSDAVPPYTATEMLHRIREARALVAERSPSEFPLRRPSLFSNAGGTP